MAGTTGGNRNGDEEECEHRWKTEIYENVFGEMVTKRVCAKCGDVE